MKQAACVVALLLLGCSCEDADEPTSTSSTGSDSSGSGAGSMVSGSTTGSSSGTGAGEVGGAPPDEPCPNWPGWAKWDDWASAQPFCYAVDPASTVAPIEWEACDKLAAMPTGCKQMKLDWPHDAIAMAVVASVFIESSGAPIISFGRVNRSAEEPNFIMPMVAEANGVVRSALLDTRKSPTTYAWGYSTSLRGVGELRALMQVASIDDSESEALVGLLAGEPRPVLEYGFTTPGGHGFAASTDIWGTWDSNRILIAKWGEEPQEVWGPEQSGYQQTRLMPFGEFATWHEGDAEHSNLIAWNPEDGAYPFISFGNDDTQGAEAIGTDGVDMVWIQSSGRLPNGDYAVRDVMTSPFTTDPQALDPRRLRSYPDTYTNNRPTAVGCGYAAFSYTPGKVMVIRLADGYWWQLGNNACSLGDFCFEEPYAITCDEIFLQGGVGMNIARVELSALGDPNPPD